MGLQIELSPEMQRRLEHEAARQGRDPRDFARLVLEEKLAAPDQAIHAELAALFAELPRRTPEGVQAFLLAQGAKPVERFEDLVGNCWPEDESVDDFLTARKQWQYEGRPGFSGDGPEEAESGSPEQ